MTTVNTALPGKQPRMNRGLRFSRKVDAFVDRLTRVPGIDRQAAAFMLHAGVAALALAAIFALQAAFYVCVWRLPV